jgi:hypothetical protein
MAALWDRFAAFDPGLTRLTSAMRAVLGTAAALAVLTTLRAPDDSLWNRQQLTSNTSLNGTGASCVAGRRPVTRSIPFFVG